MTACGPSDSTPGLFHPEVAPYFQQAIEIDPGCARAYLGLSQAYGVLGIFGEMPTAEAFPKARAAEQKAL